MGSMQSYSSNNIHQQHHHQPSTNGQHHRSMTVQQTDLTFEYRQEHYLVGIILSDLQNVLTKK